VVNSGFGLGQNAFRTQKLNNQIRRRIEQFSQNQQWQGFVLANRLTVKINCLAVAGFESWIEQGKQR
jgi:hypothetical protein